MEPSVEENREEESLDEMFSLRKKRKKKSDAPLKNELEPTEEIAPLYDYSYMLSRVYEQRVHTPTQATRVSILGPKVHRVSIKKSIWLNFKECCESIDRDHIHVAKFFNEESGTECIINNNHLVMKGNMQQRIIETVYKKYITKYVRCQNCQSVRTKINRDPKTKLNFLVCEVCSCNYSI